MRDRIYMGRRKKRRGRKLKIAVLLLLVGISGYLYVNRSDSPIDVPIVGIKNDNREKPTDISKVEGNYLFSGTIVLARAVENEARAAGGYDYNQPFSKLNTFDPNQYDAWIADLECPVTTNDISYQQQIANTVFNCRPEWLPTFSKYFQMVSLAGNHTHDMGAEGFPETVEHLEKAGIQSYGNYTPREKDDLCEVIALPVKVVKKSGESSKGTMPVAFCAFHYFSFTPEEGEIETIERYAKVMPVFGFMHVGVEYVAKAGVDQTEIGRKIIDRGAEFVIGNSAHWVQNTEAYKGKLIVYSTGNFIFDQLDNETNRGLNIATKMTIKYNDSLSKLLELGEKCKPREDTCLEEAEKQNLKKPDISLKHTAIGSTNGYREVTQIAGEAMQRAIEERANWAETLKQLN